jgi:hypothetical protein
MAYQSISLQTTMLLAKLRARYPEKNWRLQPYQDGLKTAHVIIFDENAAGIYNPLLSPCGNFEQDDLYGLSLADAEAIFANNRRFDEIKQGS